MSQTITGVNLAGKAPLFNVSLCMAALDKAINRPHHLPGFVVFYGPSGYGKSSSAAATVTQTSAYFIQAQSAWTRKAFYIAMLKVMGISPAKTMYEMSEQIANQLVNSRKALIIDEADHLVDKGTVEVVRDIYEATLAPIMLIGEENLPNKLKKYERFHGRVLEFAPAQPASLADAKALRTLYVKKVSITDDLLSLVHSQSRGSVRRICVNFERIQSYALENGLTEIDQVTWGNNELYTGEAPTRRLAL